MLCALKMKMACLLLNSLNYSNNKKSKGYIYILIQKRKNDDPLLIPYFMREKTKMQIYDAILDERILILNKFNSNRRSS